MLSSVSTRVSEEVYKKQRTIADNKAITMVEAMDDLIMGYEMTIQKLQEEIKTLKQRPLQVEQTKQRKPREAHVHNIDPNLYRGNED